MLEPGFEGQFESIGPLFRPGRVPGGTGRRDERPELTDSHPAESRLVLGHLTHPPANFENARGRVQSQHPHVPRVGLDRIRQGAEGGRFALTVSAQERERLPRRDGHVHAPQSLFFRPISARRGIRLPIFRS